MLNDDIFTTNEKTIKIALVNQLFKKYKNIEHTRIIPELTLPNKSVRVDVAVVNGIMHGYELKSDKDTLFRLPKQVNAYSSVFDRVTLVAGKKHMAKALELIPDWWGMTIAKSINDEIPILIPIRDAQNNPYQDILSVVKLLWKQEILDYLHSIGKSKGLINKSKDAVCMELVKLVEQNEIKNYVRDILIHRNFNREKQVVLSLSLDDE